jgi:DNA polymerase
VRPAVIVCLGATALQSVLGPGTTLASLQGTTAETPFGPVVATLHPAAVIRAPDRDAREAAFVRLVDDLRRARELAATIGKRT